VPLIGFLDTERPGAIGPLKPLIAFRQGLFELGYVEGTNVDIAYRYAGAQYEPTLVVELAHRGVAVIGATGKPTSALAAKAVTAAIAIVFVTDANPVELGLVGSTGAPQRSTQRVPGCRFEQFKAHTFIEADGVLVIFAQEL
jgi:putative ABC transport system substrate-binding protein